MAAATTGLFNFSVSFVNLLEKSKRKTVYLVHIYSLTNSKKCRLEEREEQSNLIKWSMESSIVCFCNGFMLPKQSRSSRPISAIHTAGWNDAGLTFLRFDGFLAADAMAFDAIINRSSGIRSMGSKLLTLFDCTVVSWVLYDVDGCGEVGAV